ncbi:hypothetical protein APE_1440a [Aeropyrum pernix K1]|uniref:Transcription factor Pcc1 n=1 Tax=Aeropyrum pernix (strain ATCC 700893 / DSM 11879 / JCM 9820 / NBRC 100138 / K1) TaxID=272557 RepID=Q05E10_AERPE|nr:KEOPS complex subunit Pcc1 [Aeropyrum pernix]BAF34791.1 hypothetical protein APE_1440a [Aeropyrum pernix K1]
MSYRARLRLCLGTDSEAIYRSLEAEARQRGPSKGVVKLGMDDGCVVLHIRARDLAGLRAITNSFLLLIHASLAAISGSATRGEERGLKDKSPH